VYSLLLDTSTEKCFIAFACDKEIIFHSQLPVGLQSAQMVLPELQKGFQATGLGVRDMHFVCSGIGPGSYTGMRVGAAVAKTIAFSCGIPLIGVCSLALFIPEIGETQDFAAVIDAKIGGLYVQKWKMVEGKKESASLPHTYSLLKAAEFLRSIDKVVTPNSMRWRPKLEALIEDTSWQWEENYPSPVEMLKVATDKYARKEYSLNGQLELLYMRKTQAELEKETS
jgi:tRNA threonylcarbamoyl adenosine modification protein YeaZ